MNKKTGCAKCAGNAPFTNDEVVAILNLKNIKLLGKYCGTAKKSDFKCLKCNKVWRTTAGNVVGGRNGCPGCSPSALHTDEKIIAILQSKNIKLVGKYIGVNKKTTFECLECNNIWDTSPGNIIYRNSRCSKCVGNKKYTDEEATELINKHTNVIKIGEYNGGKSPLEVQCKKCLIKYVTTFNNLVNLQNGCPKCIKRTAYTKDEINQILKSKNIEVIGDYYNTHTKSDFKCLKCNKVWNTTATSIVHSGSGCPLCNLSYNEKLVSIFLDKFDIKYENPFHIKGFKNKLQKKFLVDFYLPDFNLIIEYNGIQHYIPGIFIKDKERALIAFEKQVKRDKSLKSYCYRNKIKLLVIDGRKYKKDSLWQFLKQYFYELTGKTIDQVAREKF